MPNRIVLFGGKMMGKWAALCLQIFLQTKIIIKGRENIIKDEKETGLRAILNFGHTFGHAIELGLGYGNWLHGEAVGCGMIMAAELSSLLGYINNFEKIRIKEIIKQIGLPVYPPDFGFDRWLSLIELDKKNIDNKNLITLRKFRSTTINSNNLTCDPRTIFCD